MSVCCCSPFYRLLPPWKRSYVIVLSKGVTVTLRTSPDIFRSLFLFRNIFGGLTLIGDVIVNVFLFSSYSTIFSFTTIVFNMPYFCFIPLDKSSNQLQSKTACFFLRPTRFAQACALSGALGNAFSTNYFIPFDAMID